MTPHPLFSRFIALSMVVSAALLVGCETTGPKQKKIDALLMHPYDDSIVFLPTGAGQGDILSATLGLYAHSELDVTGKTYGGLVVQFAVLLDGVPGAFEGYARSQQWPKAVGTLDPLLVNGKNADAWFAAGVCHEKIADDMFVLSAERGKPTQFSSSDAVLDSVITELEAAIGCYREATTLAPTRRHIACHERAQKKLQKVVKRQHE